MKMMKSCHAVMFAAAISISVPLSSQQPQEAELHRRFNAAVMRADPAWREESSLLRGSPGSPSSQTWRRRDMDLVIRHYAHETADAARQSARGMAEGSSVGFRPIDGFGDEAYLIDSSSSLSVGSEHTSLQSAPTTATPR